VLPAELALENVTLLTPTIAAGETVKVAVTVRNPAGRSDNVSLVLTANNATLVDETLTVAGTTDRTIRLNVQIDEPGRYALTLNGVQVGTLTVEPRNDDVTSTPDPAAQPTTPPARSPEGTAEPEETRQTPSTAPADDSEVITDPDGSVDAPGFSLLLGVVAVLLFGWLAASWRQSR
jgi:hypothetical protein